MEKVSLEFGVEQRWSDS